MDVESLAKELILKNMTPEQQMAVLDSVRQSVIQAKEVQKKKIGENVDLVVQALKKIESDITTRFESVGNSIEKRVLSIKDGRDGSNGKDGRDGKDGKSGKDGLKGDRGADGQAGRDGVDGVDGVSVVNANIDFDGSLVISLSDGREINVGEVVSADVAEKIKVISTMSTNAAIAVKEEGTTLTSGAKSLNFVGSGITATTSGDDVTVTVASGSGTVTSVAATAGTGISVSGSPITTTGTLTITNSAPDQTVALTQGGTTTITGTYPSFTISSADQFQGTVTSVTGTSPVASSGGATPAISLASGYGDTLNPYASKTANFVLAAPDGSAGVPTFRAVVAADIPTLNQSTTGSAATLTTGRTIEITGDLAYTSPSFNGSANVTATGTLATVNANVGSFTNASVTVNAKGLVTAVSNGTAGGTVTSVAATVPSFLSISGSPVTTSGTLAIGLSGTALPVANGGTGVTTSTGSGANVLGTSPSISGAVLSSMASSVITSSTSVASTSGTAIDFTALPSWVKRITVIFQNVSLTGNENYLVQLGTGGTPTYTTSGYTATSTLGTSGGNSIQTSTSGLIMGTALASGFASGSMVITNITGNSWVSNATLKRGTDGVLMSGGDVSLGAVLTAVRITRSGTSTFDSGTINIFFE